MGQTPLNNLPYPEATEQPYVHLDIRELADAVDPALSVVCTSATRPAHRAGRRIFETDTRLTWISDGVKWLGVTSPAILLAEVKTARQAIPTAAMTQTMVAVLPADAPAGMYRIDSVSATASTAAAVHFTEVRWGASVLNTPGNAVDAAANVTVLFPWTGRFSHLGGAATISLRAQVNSGTANAREGSLLTVQYIGPQ